MIAVPTLETGDADEGAIDLARTLTAAGHRALVVSRGGRLEDELAACGAQLVRLDMASINPAIMARNAFVLARLIRQRHCGVVHALARAPGWSAYAAARMTGVPFVTTWYGGFRDQNLFKHAYNSVMARGEQVIAMSDQIADIISERHRVAAERIAVIPSHIDISRFDPTRIAPERIDADARRLGRRPRTPASSWWSAACCAARATMSWSGRRAGSRTWACSDFAFVLVGEDNGGSSYSGELWDIVMATETTDVIRMAGPLADEQAAYLGRRRRRFPPRSSPKGLQRSLLEAMAMARPVIVSDLAAGSDTVLAPPAVTEDRMTGWRFRSGDDAGLAVTLIRLLSASESTRRPSAGAGAERVKSLFASQAAPDQMLAVYTEMRGPQPDPGRTMRCGPALPQRSASTTAFKCQAAPLTCRPFVPIFTDFRVA